MKKATKVLLATAALTVGLSTPAMAANVSVTLPQFPVTLNGTTIDNSYREYPLLVYKDITYFPMTYYDCRFLGVETEWTKEKGLKINKSNLNGAYHQQNVQQKNKKNDVAQIASGKITVNGKSINNSKEQYPLLSYRNVTYFPLTWRFAVDEFGWKYNFNGVNGLTIDAGNAQTNSVTLNDARKPYGDTDIFTFAIDAKYLYYQGQKGEVYQRPLSDLANQKQRKTIANIPFEDDYFTGYPYAEFFEEGGRMYYRYHSGGATMGGECLYRIENNKVSEDLTNRSYDYYTDFGDFQVEIPGTVIGGRYPSPMAYRDKNGVTKSLGGDKFYYNVKADSYDKKRQVLYASAYQREANDQPGKSYLYSVSLKDGAATKLIEDEIFAFEVTDDAIYYLTNHKPDSAVDKNNYLYQLDLVTGETQFIRSIGNSPIDYYPMFTATDNGVYYCQKGTGNLLFWNKHTGNITNVNDSFPVTRLYRQNGYVVAHFKETPDNPNRLLVLKPSGQTMKQVYASSDCADKAVINANGVLVYRLEGTNQLVKVQV